MTCATINPYTNELVKQFPDATDEEVERALAKADAAFRSWRESPFAERAAVMSKAASLLREAKKDYARILTLEMGKVTAEAEAEVELSAQIFEYYAKNAESLLRPEKLPVADSTG